MIGCIAYPSIVFNGTANAITGALGVAPASESDETHSEQEIRQLIAQSTEHGVLEEDEESRLKGVFDLDSLQLLEAIKRLTSGEDLGGNKLEGAVEFHAGDSVQLMHPGDFVHLAPRSPHALKAVKDSSVLLTICLLPG